MSSALREFATAFARVIVFIGGGLVAFASVALAGTAVLLAPMFLGIYAKYGEVAAVYELKVLGDTWGPIVGVINVLWMMSIVAAAVAWVSVVENHRKGRWESDWDVLKRLLWGDGDE